ncbi:hypothetical protein AAY52_12245 [Vibrio metoecus]|nr:hypothetical protein AAY52_12245 [Vibrio metoecus]
MHYPILKTLQWKNFIIKKQQHNQKNHQQKQKTILNLSLYLIPLYVITTWQFYELTIASNI